MKSFFLRKKKSEYIPEKEGKHNLNIACMLIFHLGNQNTTSENITPMLKNMMQNKS